MLIIVSPLLLETLMFWNNDSFLLGLKSIEKSATLLFFPLFIIGNYKIINTLKLLRYYGIITTLILITSFIRFIYLYPLLIQKYVKGIDLIEMGYKFSESIGMHAPALNMHVTFVAIINLYFFIKQNDSYLYKKILNLLLFIIAFFFIMFINTRTSLIGFLFSFFVVLFFQFRLKVNFKKIVKQLVIIVLFTSITGFIYIKNNPYIKEKYSTVTFGYMDKIGKLDEINHPEIKVFNSLVTRVSIWKSALELSKENLLYGFGASDGKLKLVDYYKKTNQKFLAKYEFPVHNQILDFLLKYGIIGVFVVILYLFNILYIGKYLKNELIISFFIIFSLSNFTDDFLIRFDGIAYSGFFISIFSSVLLQRKDQKVEKY